MAKIAKQIAEDDNFYDLLGPDLKPARHNPPNRVSESDLAVFWGVSTRQVRQLVTEQVIQRSKKEFDLCQSTQKYIRHLIGLANQRGKADPKLAAEKLRLAKEQADKLEIANAAKRGEMVSAISVQNTWAEILRDIRAGLLAASGRLQSQLPHLTIHDVKTIESEIKSILRELANGND